MKLRRLEDLPELLKGKKVVLANGCFDILHVGHLRYLQGARKLGDALVVAINSDRSVRTIKDEGRPILTENERIALVSALGCVDYIVVFDEPDVSRVLDILRPACTPRAPTTRRRRCRSGTKSRIRRFGPHHR